MDATDGLQRGQEVVATGNQITMPTGDGCKRKTFNVVGNAIDGLPNLSKDGGLPIHREAPHFDQLSTSAEVLFTGIKVIDLYRTLCKRW